MSAKRFWLIYDAPDYARNQAFADMFRREGERRGLDMRLVITGEALPTVKNGLAQMRIGGEEAQPPDFAISRCRDALLLRHIESMGVPVFNPSSVCEVCNDKRRTHQEMSGLGIPMPDTVFLSNGCEPPEGTEYPVVIKPACSHGGDRVRLVKNENEWREATRAIWPMAAIQQRPVSDIGRDKRVYALFGRLVAAVERRARGGFLANYSQGADASLAPITDAERELAQKVMSRLPIKLAGIDFLYDGGKPVLSEVEDVVGCRMLYKSSDINIVSLYMDGILQRV